MSSCRTCLSRLSSPMEIGRRSWPLQARAFASTPVGRNDELEKAKARAWYLDPKPKASTSRQPRFTTFDPESTRSDLETQQIIPLPSNATSPILVQLHDHLTKQSDSVDAGSVRFLHTPSSRFLAASPAGDGEGVALLGESGGTNWEWVVTCQVKGRGRGVLNRAEKEIRKWVCPLLLSISGPPLLEGMVMALATGANDRCAKRLVVEHVQEQHHAKKAIPTGRSSI
jgi:hypothetical protein